MCVYIYGREKVSQHTQAPTIITTYIYIYVPLLSVDRSNQTGAAMRWRRFNGRKLACLCMTA